MLKGVVWQILLILLEIRRTVFLAVAYFEKAKELHLKSLEDFKTLNDYTGCASCFSGLGNIEFALQNYETAIMSYQNSIDISNEHKLTTTKARALNDLALVYEAMKNYKKAITYLEESYQIRIQNSNVLGMIATELNLGRLHKQQQQYDKSIEYYQKAVTNSETILARPRLQKAYFGLAEVYKLLQDHSKALEYFEKYMEVHSIVIGEENEIKHKNLQMKHNLEKVQQEAEIHKLKNIELKQANDVIEAQTKSIIDSINYAKRIQEAILPLPSEINKYADTSFLMYEPKDIVSGDFYWFTEKKCEEGRSWTIIAAVDCTGHGVPGAFMVVMANSLLSQIINEQDIVHPTQILHKLDEKIRQLLHQDKGEISTQDGLDIALLAIDFDTQDLYFAGAKNPLYYVRNNEMNIIKGSPFPIGGNQHREEKVFETHHLKMQLADMYYIFTDGFQDQFGGQNNTKYNRKKFRELLFSISQLPTQTQKEILKNEFLTWKADYHQTDDVLVIGLAFTEHGVEKYG
jgi:serine phosphatase RsbU (regulator of sigma subunit)